MHEELIDNKSLYELRQLNKKTKVDAYSFQQTKGDTVNISADKEYWEKRKAGIEPTKREIRERKKRNKELTEEKRANVRKRNSMTF